LTTFWLTLDKKLDTIYYIAILKVLNLMRIAKMATETGPGPINLRLWVSKNAITAFPIFTVFLYLKMTFMTSNEVENPNAKFFFLGIDVKDVKVHIKHIHGNTAQMMAIINLDFGDFEVKGFRIMRSKFEKENNNPYWIVPPTYQSPGGGRHPLFYTANKDLWKALEKIIVNQYEKECRGSYDNTISENEVEINEGRNIFAPL